MTSEEYKAICKNFDIVEEEIKQLRRLVANSYIKSEMTDIDSARKETAKEILQKIYNLFIFAEESEQKIVIDATYICDFAEREYGIEVDE